MEPRFVDVINGRDALAAGWDAERLAASGMIVQIGGGLAGARRFGVYGDEDVEIGQAIEALAGAADEGAGKPARWALSGLRLDVVGNFRARPIVQWLDPRMILRMPRRRWETVRAQWEAQGFVFTDHPDMTAGWRDELERVDAETALVPYVHVYPSRDGPGGNVEVFGFATDLRQPRLADWMLEQQRWVGEETGCSLLVVGFKSGVWDNWPSRVQYPSGVLRYGDGVWSRAARAPGNASIITTGHYGPGEFEGHFMTWLRRLLAEGLFDLVLNEAYPHRGIRWTWAEKHPDVAASLVGELVERRPWEAAP